jgi:hypothetical protein
MEKKYDYFYEENRGLYMKVDIMYSHIDGKTLDECYDKISQQCKKKGLIYHEGEKSKGYFIVPSHIDFKKTLSAEDDFYEFINERKIKRF